MTLTVGELYEWLVEWTLADEVAQLIKHGHITYNDGLAMLEARGVPEEKIILALTRPNIAYIPGKETSS